MYEAKPVNEVKIKALLKKAEQNYLRNRQEAKTDEERQKVLNRYKVDKYSILMMNGVIPSDGNMY